MFSINFKAIFIKLTNKMMENCLIRNVCYLTIPWSWYICPNWCVFIIGFLANFLMETSLAENQFVLHREHSDVHIPVGLKSMPHLLYLIFFFLTFATNLNNKYMFKRKHYVWHYDINLSFILLKDHPPTLMLKGAVFVPHVTVMYYT